MSKLLSDLALSLEPYIPGEQPKNVGELIKLNTNENPYPPAPQVLEAVAACANDSLRLYPDPTSLKMREAIAKVEGHGLTASNIFIGNGSDEVLAFCYPAFFTGKRPLCYADVTYSFYKVYAKLYGVESNVIPLNDDYTIDSKAFATADSGGAIIPNPNAPTGIALSLDEIAQIAKATDGVVVVDEAYTSFGAESAVKLLADFDNILIVRTLSKTHSLAGLRLGYAIGSEELISGLIRVKDSFNSYPVDRIAHEAGTAAIHATEYYSETCRKVRIVRDSFSESLKVIGFNVLPSCSNFIFTSPPDSDAKRLFSHLKEHNILVRYFDSPRTKNWLRITIGTEYQMEIVLERIKDLYKQNS